MTISTHPSKKLMERDRVGSVLLGITMIVIGITPGVLFLLRWILSTNPINNLGAVPENPLFSTPLIQITMVLFGLFLARIGLFTIVYGHSKTNTSDLYYYRYNIAEDFAVFVERQLSLLIFKTAGKCLYFNKFRETDSLRRRKLIKPLNRRSIRKNCDDHTTNTKHATQTHPKCLN